MKVLIEVPKSAIKKAAYFLMSQTTSEEENETIDKAVEALEKEECVNMQKVFEGYKGKDADQVYMVFAIAALAAKVKDIADEQNK